VATRFYGQSLLAQAGVLPPPRDVPLGPIRLVFPVQIAIPLLEAPSIETIGLDSTRLVLFAVGRKTPACL
jgi:hypothetical protein